MQFLNPHQHWPHFQHFSIWKFFTSSSFQSLFGFTNILLTRVLILAFSKKSFLIQNQVISSSSSSFLFNWQFIYFLVSGHCFLLVELPTILEIFSVKTPTEFAVCQSPDFVGNLGISRGKVGRFWYWTNWYRWISKVLLDCEVM